MRVFTTSLSIVAGALLLGACRAGSEAAPVSEAVGASGAKAGARDLGGMTFCEGAEALYEQFVSAGINDPGSQAMRQVFEDAYSLEPPPEIAEDWQAILDSVEPLVTGEIDLSDPAAMEELSRETTANAGAYERVGVYTAQVCGISPTTTPPAADAAASMP